MTQRTLEGVSHEKQQIDKFRRLMNHDNVSSARAPGNHNDDPWWHLLRTWPQEAAKSHLDNVLRQVEAAAQGHIDKGNTLEIGELLTNPRR